MKNIKKKEKSIIGWREFIDLPAWGIRGLRAKVDTGATTSALHVEDVKELEHNQIEFYVILNQSKARKKVVTKRIKKGRVKSSIGVKTSRWYVETTIRIGDIKKKIPVNLVGREGMNFRMLIGRNSLKGDFLVDVSRSFLTIKSKKRRKKKIRK